MKNIIKSVIAFILISVFVAAPMSAFADDDVNYIITETNLTVGANSCPVDSGYEYTVIRFIPEDIGKYTVSASNAKIGIVSYNGLWVTTVPSNETVNESEVTSEFTSVGQSILIAIRCDGAAADLTVTYNEITVIEIPWTDYVNKQTPIAFDFSGNFDDLTYVDTDDDICDEAVLGSDGYYHHNSENGAILYAKFDDELMSLVEAQGYGQLRYVKYDNGEVSEKIDYYNAFNEYLVAADSETMLYPLTEDIITIYKTVGIFGNWYGENGFIGGTEDDAWMFACYYDKTYVAPPVTGFVKGDVNGSGEVDAQDYGLAKRHVLGTYTLDEDQIKRGDINGNGELEANEYALIKRHVLGTYEIK